MDRQERKEEREFGCSIVNFSCSEILKFILKSVRHGIGVTVADHPRHEAGHCVLGAARRLFFQVVAFILLALSSLLF